MFRLLLTSKVSALNEILSLLKAKGGAAALEHVRTALSRTNPDPPDRFKGFFLARLVPWIAREDPSVLPAALDLSRSLLHSGDEWVRFQTIAGLGGFQSTRPGGMSAPDGSDFRFWFMLDPADPKELVPSDRELRTGFPKVLESDPTFRALLGEILSNDSESRVREGAAYALGATRAPETEPLLYAALASDENQEVRIRALESLSLVGSARLPAELVQLVANEDEVSALRVAALKMLPESGPATAESESLLGMALTSESFGDSRRDAVMAAFDYLKRNSTSTLGPQLISAFGANEGNERVLRVFVDRAVQDGRAEYVALFGALQTASPDPDIKEMMAAGIRDLQGRDAYLESARKIEDLTAVVRGLWGEFTNPATPGPRRNEISQQINTLISQLDTLRSRK